MRGIRVDILLPEENNLRMVQWASTAMLWQVLERGCRVWASPPPFDHTKLLIVDGIWAMFGSANWDARSLRLNFEFNVECYGRDLAGSLEEAGSREDSTCEADQPGGCGRPGAADQAPGWCGTAPDALSLRAARRSHAGR